MASLQVIGGRERDLGGFSVRRVLPFETRQMVGPFIFFDHLGPTQLAPGTGIDVRPHPHIALATVTYLFSGSLEHRDSLGTVREIRPGDVNWMSAGHGIAHSERTPHAARASGEHVHGIQSWVALPDGHEDGEPTFAHYPAASLPARTGDGIELTVIAGAAFGLRSPVATLWPTLYVHAQITDGAALEMSAEHAERAIYVADGALDIDGILVTAGYLAVLEPGAKAVLRAIGDTRAMLLGGDRFPTRRYIWWNFVASSQERIERAKERWQRRQFPDVPGETEFIPLPRI
ncbi:MAG TPA: pirin family protein [Steroidobacteraceae bacterium]|nr:pirin family protein [Steroidobacteraceae bacterium]